MPIATGAAPGAAYILHDYTIVQVLAVTDAHVRFRVRGRAWPWRPVCIVERRVSLAWLMGHIRAEIDGGFFPDLVTPSAHRFRHAAEEVSALRHHLNQRAAHRPFALAR